MSKIKLNNNKVIITNGKASCECCGCKDNFLITDRNVFEITKQEHDQYKKGGTWNCNLNFQIRESVLSVTPPCNSSGGASKTFSVYQEGCAHGFEFSSNGLITYSGLCFGDREDELFLRTEINIRLRYYNDKYYMKVLCVTLTSSGFLGQIFTTEGSLLDDTGLPPTTNCSIDGNNLTVVRRWIPPWSIGGYSEYTNTSTFTLNATFTPKTTI